MEFRQALTDMVLVKKLRLSDDGADKAVLVNYASYCKTNNDLLQMQELKNILSTGVNIGSSLLGAYNASKRAGDASFGSLEEKIEEIADELEKNNISCFSYSYFLSCYLDLFKELYKDPDYAKLGISTVAWIDPEKYDYEYKSMPTDEKTFGFGRYRASIKDFKIKNRVLTEYTGKDPYVIVPEFVNAIGKNAFSGNKKIKSVYVPRSVTKIGASAFSDCEKLETVILSDSLAQLPSAVFEGCKLLKRINTGNIKTVGNRCFKDCVQLRDVDFHLLTSVGDEAFSHCIGLKNMSFVSNLTKIGYKAFEHCMLNYVSLEKCTNLGAQAFLNCASVSRIFLSSRIAKIGSAPFMGCTAVSLLDISKDSYTGYVYRLFADDIGMFNAQMSKLTCIKKDSLINDEFASYRHLKEVEIRDAEVVPDRAFANCAALSAVRLNKPIKAIGQSAFESCASLGNLDMVFIGEEISARAFYKCTKADFTGILNIVKRVGDFAFAYTDLSGFTFRRQFEYIGLFAFANAKFPQTLSLDLGKCKVLPGAFHGVREIKMLRIDSPKSLYRGQLHLLFDSSAAEFSEKRKINYLFVNGDIHNKSFKNYSNIRYIEFDTAGRIPDEAFAGCSALESVKINGTVTSVGDYAFSVCGALASLSMKYSSVTVGRSAFEGCRNIRSLIDLGKITSFGEYSFANTDVSELVLDRNVRFIGESAFSGCSAVEKVVIPFVGTVPRTANSDPEPFGKIFGTQKREGCNVQSARVGQGTAEYYVPGGISSVTVLSDTLSEGCFGGCGFLTEINLPSVEDFTERCFDGCTNLRNINLGSSLERFSARAVAGCAKNVKISIAEGCDRFVSKNGTVMSKNMEKLYFLDFSDTLENRISELRAIGAYAVAHAPTVLRLPAGLAELEAHAINCGGVKAVSVDSAKGVCRAAFYNCDSLESLSLASSDMTAAFATVGGKLSLRKLALSDCAHESIRSIFVGAEQINVDNLMLDNVQIEGNKFFDKISSIENIDIKSVCRIARGSFGGVKISSLSTCAQILPLGELFGKTAKLDSLTLKGAQIRESEFAGITVDTLMLENADVICARAFADACIDKLLINGVKDIERGAFAASAIKSVSVSDSRYKFADGILYREEELVYCFDKSMQSIAIPAFVKKVSAGAIDSVVGLKQLTVSHSDILFDRGAVVNCSKLSDIELCDISNNTLRELFDTVDGITSVKYSGKKIKKKFLSHMTGMREISLTGVVEIGDLAFLGNTALDKILGLGNVKYIGGMAFADCAALKTAALSQACSHIGLAAFEGCSSLSKISYPIDAYQIENEMTAQDIFGEDYSNTLKLEIIGGDIPEAYFENFGAQITVTASAVNVGARAFRNSGLWQIDLGKTAYIGEEAFSGTRLKSVELPSAVRIEARAFAACASLSEVVLNGGIEYLGEDWIAESSVAKLSGAERGMHYRTASNYLVDGKDGTLVYVAPENPIIEIVVDERVAKISASAFAHSDAVSIDAGAVAEIEEGAFEKCARLKKLRLQSLSHGKENVALSFFTGANRKIEQIEILRGELAEGCFASFDKLKSLTLPEGIKRIERNCFSGCAALTSIGGLGGAEYFGENAFGGCVSLEALELPFLGRNIESPEGLGYLFDSSYGLSLKAVKVLAGKIAPGAFENFTSLISVALPPKTELIPAKCFSCCSKLEEVVNTEYVKQIDTAAFIKCFSLKSLIFPAVESVADRAFASCTALTKLALSPALKQVGSDILIGCGALSKLTAAFTESLCTVALFAKDASDSLSEVCLLGSVIGKGAFDGCRRLEKVMLSDSINEIPYRAFADCTSLRTVICGSDVTQIGDSAFRNCSALTEMRLPASLVTVGAWAFADSALSGNITLDKIREIGMFAFAGSAVLGVTLGKKLETVSRAAFSKCEKLRKVVFGASVHKIEDEAFAECKSLSDVSLCHVVSIGSKAFYGCTSLQSASVDELEWLGESAFEKCGILRVVTFGNMLTVIPELAFAGCEELYKINLPSGIEKIGNRAFAGTAMKKLELRVPSSLVAVGEYVFENADSPIVCVADGQTDSWHPNWKLNCKRHGLLYLSRKVITKKL